jgi:hypothetical protein
LQESIEKLVDQLFTLFDSMSEEGEGGGEGSNGDGVITNSEFKACLDKFNAGLSDEEVWEYIKTNEELPWRAAPELESLLCSLSPSPSIQQRCSRTGGNAACGARRRLQRHHRQERI